MKYSWNLAEEYFFKTSAPSVGRTDGRIIEEKRLSLSAMTTDGIAFLSERQEELADAPVPDFDVDRKMMIDVEDVLKVTPRTLLSDSAATFDQK